MSSTLPIPFGPIAAIVAHPDDESFGLGAVLALLATDGHPVHVLCFTHGEASTIGAVGDLGAMRAKELSDAAAALNLTSVTLLGMADGQLDAVPPGGLDAEIDCWLDPGVVGLVVLSPNGVTGHPDHRAVTAAAERVADLHGVITIEWGVDPATAAELRERYGLAFFAIDDGDDVFDVHVSRDRQLAAVQCHRSQLDKDPVVLRRLAIQGDRERVRIRQPQRGNPS